MLARAVWVVGLVGCYAPTAGVGAPCDERRLCPSDQVCVNGRCSSDGTTPDAPDVDAPPIDGAQVDASADAPPMLGPWSSPAAVGIAVGSSKSDPSFTPNRLTVVFGRNDDVFIATRPAIGGAWNVADLDELNTANDEKSPEITADGKTIYFAANPDGDYDIFVSTLDLTGAWSMPIKVPNWSGSSNEQDVAISPDELTAFVAISGDLRRSVRMTKNDAWPAPVSVGVDWGTDATAPSINSAGDVYFHANNPRDLFVARKTPTGYASPVPVSELNSGDRDAAPFIAGDDRHIMFDRDSELVESSR